MDSTQTAFDAAYWLFQPPQVRALALIGDQDQRAAQAATLATQGFVIDVPIMVWMWDPYLVMTMRVNYGYTWVPSALQPPVSMVPGLSVPGVMVYDPTHPPAGSIKVSTNIADYPPFNPPQPPPSSSAPPPPSDPVGIQSVGTLYQSIPGDVLPDGSYYTDSRGTFVKHVIPMPFGTDRYWELITPTA